MMKIILFMIKYVVRIAPMYFLLASVRAMKWGVIVEGDETVEGLIVGTQEFIDRRSYGLK
jgi:hypothetical protein